MDWDFIEYYNKRRLSHLDDVIGASHTPFYAAMLGHGQPEICKLDSLSVGPAEVVLVGIRKLGKDAGAKTCPTNVDLLGQNERDHVTALSEIHD
jgi:hypothetical protein